MAPNAKTLVGPTPSWAGPPTLGALRARRAPVVTRAAPGRWLAGAALVTIIAYAVAGVAALGLAQREREGTGVQPGTVTGRAAVDLGNGAAFTLRAPPPGVRPVVPRADAESTAVAFAYGLGPSIQVARGQHVEDRPTERRRLCGRSYYVRPVVALPDPAAVPAVTADLTTAWGPTWVVPVCDGAGVARTTVLMADAPTRLRVVLGDAPDAVPELVYPVGSAAHGATHVGAVDPGRFRDWEGGLALSPERAVTVAVAALAGTGARVAEVPEAFQLVVTPQAPQTPAMRQAIGNVQACPRWRLTLDRAVALRGITSGQVVRTRTVYVTRGDGGCDGAPALQVSRPVQPTTLPFLYGVAPSGPVAGAPARDGRSADPGPPELRWTALRVTEPVWFEGARLAPVGSPEGPRRASASVAGPASGTRIWQIAARLIGCSRPHPSARAF